MAVSKRLRYEILRRDNHTCRYCGSHAPDVTLTIDHVTPTTLGGTDDPSNLVTACSDCNNGKSATTPGAPLIDDVAADALRWAAAMTHAAELADTQRGYRDDHRRWVNRHWNQWTSSRGEPHPRPVDWPLSVDTLIRAGLDVTDIFDAIDDTMLRRNIDDRWAYTCGQLWRELERRQQTAREILNTEENASHTYAPVGWPTTTGTCV